MVIIGTDLIEQFSLKHADAAEPLERWVDIVEVAQWKNHNDLKADFPSADYVGNKRYVFNIKGNAHRMVAVVVFVFEMIEILYIGTHAEYDKIKNIKEI